jgi:hypothetical protein
MASSFQVYVSICHLFHHSTLWLTVGVYVYYSPETAELRYELLEILEEEIPQTGSINWERLFQRAQSALKAD